MREKGKGGGWEKGGGKEAVGGGGGGAVREKGKGRQRVGKWSVKERGMQWIGKEEKIERKR